MFKHKAQSSVATYVAPILIGWSCTALAMEEIVVTAQKREQSITDVPVTMDVISGDFLDRTNTTELDELSRLLPNVVIQEQAVSLPSFSIRGITDDTASISSTPRISVYQDGFDISKKTVSSAALFDVERIEVLKGPQPTLFGVAAANGAISILSRKPGKEFAANGRIATNTQNGIEFQGMVNAPISENFSFRLASLVREQDGVVNNQACSPDSFNPSGQIEDNNGNRQDCAGGTLNGASVQAFRASLLADFDDLNVTLRLAQEYNDQPGINFKSGSIAPRNGDTSPFSDAELGFGSLLGIERDLQSIDLTVNYLLTDNIELSFDTFHKEVDLTENFDADGSALRIQDAYFKNDTKIYGASTRAVFSVGEDFTGFVGLSYNRDKSILPFTILVDPFLRGVFDATKANLEVLNPNIPLNQNISTTASEADIKVVRDQLVAALFNADGSPISDPSVPSFASQGPFVFEADLEITSMVAEGTYAVTDDLDVTAGLRFIDETRLTRNFLVFEAEESFTATLPRIAVNYAYNETTSLYFNYAEGRRSPVVDPNFGNTVITAAETVDSYDLGLKYFSDRVYATVSVFASNYSNYQQSFTDAVTLQSNTVTVGDSNMSGIEGMVSVDVDDSLNVTASLGLLDAKFADTDSDGSAFDYAGNQFRLAPEVSGSLSVNKTFSLASWAVDVNWVTAYQSEVFFESSNYPGLSQDAYWISDASIKFSPASNWWSVELFADNVFDEEFLIDAGNTGGGLGIPTFVRGNPVIGGLRLYAEI